MIKALGLFLAIGGVFAAFFAGMIGWPVAVAFGCGMAIATMCN